MFLFQIYTESCFLFFVFCFNSGQLLSNSLALLCACTSLLVILSSKFSVPRVCKLSNTRCVKLHAILVLYIILCQGMVCRNVKYSLGVVNIKLTVKNSTEKKVQNFPLLLWFWFVSLWFFVSTVKRSQG